MIIIFFLSVIKVNTQCTEIYRVILDVSDLSACIPVTTYSKPGVHLQDFKITQSSGGDRQTDRHYIHLIKRCKESKSKCVMITKTFPIMNLRDIGCVLIVMF